MEKKRAGIAVLVAIALGASLLVFAPSPRSGQPEVVFQTGIRIPVEIADSPAERQRGLMFREQLEGGMLFIFGQEQPLSFWMKNTLIPLDMIFISQNMEIVNILTAEPCVADPCPLYNSGAPARYVVEANAGFAREHGIEEGQLVGFHGL